MFVDPDGAGLLTQFAAEHTGRKQSLHAAEHTARREVADTILAAEVRRIAALVPVPEAAPSTEEDPGRPPTASGPRWPSCSAASRSTAATCRRGGSALDTAVSVARTHRPDLADVLEAIRAAMLADPAGLLATRVQQTSGHGDGQGRRGHRVLPLEPVRRAQRGGRRPVPLRGAPAASSTRAMAAREASWPATMTTLSTHDTKRSEDVRARLAVLAEIPGEWARRMRRWAAAHPLPDRSLELLAWQNLVGAWPIPADRMAGLPGQGGQGGQARHQPRRGRARGRRGDRGLARAGARRRRAGRRDRGVRRPDRRARPVQLAGPEAAAARRARRARRLPGHRAVRVLAGRPGQPAPGRLGARAASCSPASTTAGCPTSTPKVRRSCWSRRARCGCAGTGRRCSPATGRCRPQGPAAAHAVAFAALGIAGRGGHPAAGGAGRPRRLGATPCSRCRTGASDWHDVITDTPVDGAAPPAGRRC